MASEDIVNGVIRYTTKELLSEIRDKLHDIKGDLAAHELRLLVLERKAAEAESVQSKYVPLIDKLVRDFDVEASVRSALENNNQSMLTRREKFLALVFAAATVGLTTYDKFF